DYIDLVYGPALSENIDETNETDEAEETDSSTNSNIEDSEASSDNYCDSKNICHKIRKNKSQDKVKAAIYLSLDEWWDIPEEIAVLAMILDPRLKGLRFVDQDERISIQEKLKKKYQDLINNQDNILSAPQNIFVNQNNDTNADIMFD
ncbi:9020_t:CDS:2, partial [Racocetra fulgida]